MEKARCIAALRADSAALAGATRLGLDAPVPSCPGWSVADLVHHIGRVHRAVTRRVRYLDMEPRSTNDIPLPVRPELVNWFEEGAEALAQVLEAARQDAPVWNWSIRPNLASFWWRRMAQETAVHRWDVQAAHARQQPISTDVAVDGVDEFLDVFLPTDLSEKPTFDLGGTVQLQCADPPASWLVTVSGELLARRDQKLAVTDLPLATVSASASDLLLLLWRRVEASAHGLETGGDAALLARFTALAELD
jgi:uncharacterized protein (TIGR03083 family)